MTHFFQVLKPEERARLIENIAGHLKDAQDFIQQRAVSNFSQVDADFGSRLRKSLDAFKKPEVNINVVKEKLKRGAGEEEGVGIRGRSG